MKILLPLILLLLGIGGGVGAGLALRPAADAPSGDAALSGDPGAPEPPAEAEEPMAQPAAALEDHAAPAEYIKLNNQFVVPVVERGAVEAVMVMSLSLEVGPGGAEAVYAHEPKLRDVFLQVMFDHANMGGFAGVFTDTARLDTLRSGLVESAAGVIGPAVKSVLITDFVRQPL
ncbi:flagellar basal body-associated FliL family protein [Roseovarius aquimarinus]|uniref:Flagellar protein FliL n=1 Tax=Roseovarius aquimarinus TaxID=1229156 RepID=A0ABW7IAW3_9RHOB